MSLLQDANEKFISDLKHLCANFTNTWSVVIDRQTLQLIVNVNTGFMFLGTLLAIADDQPNLAKTIIGIRTKQIDEINVIILDTQRET